MVEIGQESSVLIRTVNIYHDFPGNDISMEDVCFFMQATMGWHIVKMSFTIKETTPPKPHHKKHVKFLDNWRILLEVSHAVTSSFCDYLKVLALSRNHHYGGYSEEYQHSGHRGDEYARNDVIEDQCVVHKLEHGRARTTQPPGLYSRFHGSRRATHWTSS